MQAVWYLSLATDLDFHSTHPRQPASVDQTNQMYPTGFYGSAMVTQDYSKQQKCANKLCPEENFGGAILSHLFQIIFSKAVCQFGRLLCTLLDPFHRHGLPCLNTRIGGQASDRPFPPPGDLTFLCRYQILFSHRGIRPTFLAFSQES